MARRGQGSFEYLLLLGGTVLVATIVLVMMQGSVYNVNNTYSASSGNYADYVKGGVTDILANGSLTHELPTGCMYSNPPCGEGYYCSDQGVCVPIVSALLYGYVFDYSGFPISGVNVSVVGGDNSSAATNAAGYYAVSAGVSQSSGVYPVVASKAPATTQSSATVNLTVGFASLHNFTLGYNDASLSGFVRDSSSAGISGANVSCAGRSTTTAGDGSYSFSGIAMTSASTTCTIAASKSGYNPNSLTATLSAGVTAGQNVQLQSSVAAVSGYVRDGSGVGLAGASVSCAGYSATTASDGSYSISGIAMAAVTGSCTLAASKSGYTSASATVSLTAGATTTGQNLAINLIVVGACGSSNGANFYSAPSSGLCNAGTASAVSGSGPWSWTCTGAYGGATASCSANKVVDGVCGSANRVYWYTDTAYGSDTSCATGTASPATPAFPVPGGSATWYCNGAYGGVAASCSASRVSCPGCGVAVGGVCVAKSAGENGFGACKRCDGVSLYPANIASGAVDSEGSNVCSGTCQACDGNGNCGGSLTAWGSGAYGCTGSDKRCVSGSCVTCGGWFNQGHCWYEGAVGGSCDAACSDKGGCNNTPKNALDLCSVCQHWHPGVSCFRSAYTAPAWYPAQNTCVGYLIDQYDRCSVTSGDPAHQRLCSCIR
ncbi:MAG: carboxypeptidase-like regulatory domain-containing protein [Candidatus Micrarchaeia archaeon]